jgi:hypothetical protein
MTDQQEQEIPEEPSFRLPQSPSFETLKKAKNVPANGLLKRNNSDSDLHLATPTTYGWTCNLCSYENVDPAQMTCALCGTQKPKSPPRAHHPQPQELRRTPPKHPRRLALPILENANVKESSNRDPDVIHNVTSSPSANSNSESGDIVASLPDGNRKASLSTLKGAADSISLRLLDLSKNLSVLYKEEQNAHAHAHDESAATLPTSNRHPNELSSSTATIPSSNVNRHPNEFSSSAVTIPSSNVNNMGIFTDEEHSISDEEGMDPDDVSLEELFAGARRKGVVIPPPPPPTSSQYNRTGFEALPPSPQLVKKLSDHLPWELPPNIITTPGDVEEAKFPANPNFKPNGVVEEEEKAPMKTKLIRLAVFGVVGLVVILSVVFGTGENDGNGDGNETSGQGYLVTPAPSGATSLPTIAPPTATPTIPVTDPLTIVFDSETAFSGPTEGSRLGISVALNQEGTWMTALGVSGNVQVYNRKVGTDWTSHSTILVEESSSFSTDAAMDLASANDGSPMVAIASSTSFRVIQYTNGQWKSRGQDPMAWVSADGTVESIVSFSAIALSWNGQVLVAGSLTDDGMLVRIFEWQGSSWTQRGDSIVRPVTTISVLTMSLAVSGDGSVVVLGDWTISNPASTVEAFEWTNLSWTSKGGPMFLTWGPAAVALTETGHRLAVTTPSPGRTQIYEWNGEWTQIGKDLAGGSSIALTQSGSRVLLGQPLIGQTGTYDYLDEGWVANLPLSGKSGSQFGASVAMAANGNTLAIGSPLDDSNSSNAGQIFLYE